MTDEQRNLIQNLLDGGRLDAATLRRCISSLTYDAIAASLEEIDCLRGGVAGSPCTASGAE